MANVQHLAQFGELEELKKQVEAGVSIDEPDDR